METFSAGAKWVVGILLREWDGYGVLTKRAAMEAIEGGDQQALFRGVQAFVYLDVNNNNTTNE